MQIDRAVEEETDSSSFKENKNPISPATGDEEDSRNVAVMYSQRLLHKKEALLKRIAKLQKQCEE